MRDAALQEALDAADLAGDIGAQMILWPGIEGYNYPFQTPYARGLGPVRRRRRRDRRALRRARDVTLFLEHKNSEPAMKIFMRNIGMTLHVIHTLRTRGITNVQVNMDWQHLLMNGESLGEYAALFAAQGLLGHQHANSGWGTFDDDNMVGATAFMETLELALELRRAGYGDNGERLGFDLYPYTEDSVAAVRRSRDPVALHRRDVAGRDRRRRAARGAAAQGRRPRVRARLRRLGSMTWGNPWFPHVYPLRYATEHSQRASRPAKPAFGRKAGFTGVPSSLVRDVVELAQTLVRVESINPDLDPAGSGEAPVARVVADWCREAELEVTVEEAAPGRPNVIATARGSGGGKTLLLNGHLDTVGVAGMADPFSGRVEGDRLYGRGSQDMKGAVAACLVACERASRLGLRGDVVVTAVADEEVASVGTAAVAAAYRADAAIVAEPTDEKLGIAHRGFAGFHIRVNGRAAHGSLPELGVDAIAHMGPVLTRIAELDATLRAGPRHALLGTGSTHASLISGGQEYSSYPAFCDLDGERRTIPGETDEDVAREVAALVGGVDASWELTVTRGPFEIDEAEEVVRLVTRHAGEPERVGMPFWTDAALLHAAGVPTVLFGPCGDGLHTDVEWVSIASLERCVETYIAVAAELCV